MTNLLNNTMKRQEQAELCKSVYACWEQSKTIVLSQKKSHQVVKIIN